MPIPIEDYATPKFQRLRERYPLSYDKNDRINPVPLAHDAGRYQGTEGREGGWKQAGYNPRHQSTRIEKIRLNNLNIVLKPV